ncbi:MAG: tRNA preQ1(34) S-adenosylmethionine ribosyltransferase-isomerase QueA [Waddliaceae bacterium]
MDLYSTQSYHFDLPDDLIASHPVSPRDSSRVMIVNRKTGELSEIRFSQLAEYLNPEDQLIFNNTKVIPARLMGKKESGAKLELLLLQEEKGNVWQALVKPAKKAPLHTEIIFNANVKAKVIEELPEGVRRIRFESSTPVHTFIEKEGQLPLPPYMGREAVEKDKSDYQTVYADALGAVAAPTAGLHFTKELLDTLRGKGVVTTFLTLHVGLGTFKPVKVDDIRNHRMHKERYVITPESAFAINNHSKERRQIAVGTTCLRTLESSTNEKGEILSGSGTTDIFITPGYQFQATRSLLTNFHLPGSTLMMLVCAFGGYELMMEAYRKAVREKFRFFSYGDAMLII